MHLAEQNIKKSHTLKCTGSRLYHSSNASNFICPFLFFDDKLQSRALTWHSLFQPITPYNPLLSSHLLSSGSMNGGWGTSHLSRSLSRFCNQGIKETAQRWGTKNQSQLNVSQTCVETLIHFIAQELEASEDICSSRKKKKKIIIHFQYNSQLTSESDRIVVTLKMCLPLCNQSMLSESLVHGGCDENCLPLSFTQTSLQLHHYTLRHFVPTTEASASHDSLPIYLFSWSFFPSLFAASHSVASRGAGIADRVWCLGENARWPRRSLLLTAKLRSWEYILF